MFEKKNQGTMHIQTSECRKYSDSIQNFNDRFNDRQKASSLYMTKHSSSYKNQSGQISRKLNHD